MFGFGLSLAAAFAWGVSDFLGGIETRKMPALTVLAITQPVGLVLALLFVAFFQADPLSSTQFGAAVFAGAAGVAALAAFYQSMALGTISVVAPVASLGVVVPVAVGLARGEDPGLVAAVGVVLGIAGVVFLSYEEDPEHKPVARKALWLALASGLGFGVFFTALDFAEASRPGWAVVGVKTGGVIGVLVGLALYRLRPRPPRESLGTLSLIGFCDVAASALFALATTRGLLPVVAVGGSMYPAFTIGLAHVGLGERLNRLQVAGAALALVGAGLIVVGGS